MDKVKAIENCVQEIVESYDCELVGIEFKPAHGVSILRIYIDHPEGVTIDRCSFISRKISPVLDVENFIQGRYNLEVSSPGVNRKIFTEEQLEKFIGQIVKIKLMTKIEGRRIYQGELTKVDGIDFWVQIDDQAHKLNFANVAQANIIFQGE